MNKWRKLTVLFFAIAVYCVYKWTTTSEPLSTSNQSHHRLWSYSGTILGAESDQVAMVTSSQSLPESRYLVEHVRKLLPSDELHQRLLRIDRYIASIRSHFPEEYLPKYKNPCWFDDYKIPRHITKLSFTGKSLAGKSVIEEALLKEKLYIPVELFGRSAIAKQMAYSNKGRQRHPQHKGALPPFDGNIRGNDLQATKRNLFCLPYFFLLGYAKTGTTAVYDLLAQSKEFARPLSKEIQWWAWYPYSTSEPLSTLYFTRYLTHFIPAALYSYHSPDMVTGDCSVLSAFRLPFQLNTSSVLPGSMPYMYSELFKQQKFIIIMRNPVYHVRSGFYYYNQVCLKKLQEQGVVNRGQLSQLAHLTVLQHTAAFRKCMEVTGFDGSICIYDYYSYLQPSKNIPKCIFMPLGHSIYYYTMFYWLHYIPRERFLLLLTEELDDQVSLIRSLANFLDISETTFPRERFRKTIHRNQGISHKINMSYYMQPETEELLSEFFKPYNAKLAKLLNDNRFLWK